MTKLELLERYAELSIFSVPHGRDKIINNSDIGEERAVRVNFKSPYLFFHHVGKWDARLAEIVCVLLVQDGHNLDELITEGELRVDTADRDNERNVGHA